MVQPSTACLELRGRPDPAAQRWLRRRSSDLERPGATAAGADRPVSRYRRCDCRRPVCREHGLPAAVRGGGHAGAGHTICDCGVRAVEANGAAMNRSGGARSRRCTACRGLHGRAGGPIDGRAATVASRGLKQPLPRTLNRWAWKFGQLVMSSWVQFSPASRRASADRSAAILACSVRSWRRSTSLRAAGSPAVRNARMSGSGSPASFACTIDATRNRSSRV
jgi:hypothetical protein